MSWRGAGLVLGFLAWSSCGGGGSPSGGTAPAATPTPIGETPKIPVHLSQTDIDAGTLTVDDLIAHGKKVFQASFNTLDGAGRPGSTGTGDPRPPVDPADTMNRISAPDANSCAGCHFFPFVGGGGDNSSNVFVLAEKFPLVNFDEGPGDDFQEHFLDDVGIERATIGMFGSGFVELLAREMSLDLGAQRDAALAQAQTSGTSVVAPLTTKGVAFGSLTAHPDGSLDTTGIEGVDTDLIVKPFHQKGVVASLRTFSNTALNQHHGMQSSERFGNGLDADLDGVVDEVTAGDVTALTVFQATLPAPVQVLPHTGLAAEAAVANGDQLFDQVGCASCHVRNLVLLDPVFTEPGPFNLAGDLQPGDVPAPFSFDLTTAGLGPFLPKQPDGSVVVPLFTDLKRHDVGATLGNDKLIQGGVPTSTYLTKKLWGFANEPPYLHHGRALTIREAIQWHGGEAADERTAFEALTPADQDDLIAFLLTLRTPTPGVPPVTVNDESFFQEGPKMLVAHTEQDDIDNGLYDGTDMFFIGGGIFDSRWNTLDGAGRPETDGNGQPRPRRDAPQNFNRISGPDGDSCNSCHNFQNGTGGGDAVHNTFVGTGSYPFVNFDGAEGDLFQDLHLDGVGNVRSTTAIFGSGFLELLAREMTLELFALRDQALAQAQGVGSEVTVDLEAKGVSYGTLTARPDGSLDTSAVVGVDPDLVVKPFRQKGTVVSLRAFTTAAMNEHHGIQAAELFGEGSDPDADGVVDELTVGDMTMLSVYQTLVPVPGRLLPADPGQMAAVDRGEDLFGTLGCGVCHVPSLILDDPVFTEPGPFNPPEILGPADVPQPFAVDLTAFGQLPRLPRESDGTVIVPAFTDLKRHDMGPALADNVVEQGVGTQWFLTKRLWGFANEPPYLHDGRALTVSEAILWHGGEAQASRDAFEALPAFDQACVVDFLGTLRAMPGQPLVVVQ